MSQSPRVLILGGRGYLGGYYRAAYPDTIAPEVDRAGRSAVAALEHDRPEVDPAHTFGALGVGRLARRSRRAGNCLLSTAKLGAAGLGVRPVGDAVESALARAARP